MLYDDYINTLRPLKNKRILIGMFKLTEHEILDSLKHPYITFRGKLYETPRQQLLNYLILDMSGLLELELTQFEDET